MHWIVTETHRIKFPFLSGDELQCFLVDLRKLQQMSFNNVFFFLDRLRSSVKLSCNQLFLDVFKVVDHTLPGLVSTAD